MMNTFLCRLMALTFLFNVLTPDARLFAQRRKGFPKQNITGADLNYSPTTDQQIVKFSQSWGPLLKQYNPQTHQYDQDFDAVDQAKLRLFLNDASDEAFLSYLTEHKLPLDSYSMGTNEYVPGINIQRSSKNAASAALKRLNLMLERNELAPEAYVGLISSPDDAIATFGTFTTFHALGANMTEEYTEELKNLSTQFFPILQTLLFNRLGVLNNEKNDASVLGTQTILENKFKDQYRSTENIQLRGAIHLLLGRIKTAYRMAGCPDTFSEADYKKLTAGVMKSVDYNRTHKEWWLGPNASRILNSEYAAEAMIAYEGLNGFARLIRFYETQNTSTKFESESVTSFQVKKVNFPEQGVIDTPNFALITRAFMVLNEIYGPQVENRKKAMNPKELAQLRNLLIRYANSASAPTRVLALSSLGFLYEKSGPKWTSGQGYDKGAKSGRFLSDKTANQVADQIKNSFYCRLVQSTRSHVFGLDAEKMLEISTLLGNAYNAIRHDPQAYIIKPGGQGPACYVRLNQSINSAAQAQDLADEAAWFVLSWVGFGAAINAVAGGARFAANTGRALRIASKTAHPTKVFIHTVKDARVASRLARELGKDGIKIEKVISSKGKIVARDMTKTRVPSSSEVPLGYTVTQRLPGGTLTTRSIEASREMQTRLLGVGGKNLSAKNGPFDQFFDIAQQTAATLPTGTERALARSLISTEDLMYSGLKTVSKQNFATGHNMAKTWTTNAAGQVVPQYTPTFLRLSATDPLAHYNSAGKMILGNVRADLLPAMQTPGAVFTAALQAPALGTMNYLKWITKATIGFGILDKFAQPAVDKWDEVNQNNLATQLVSNADQTASQTQPPFVPKQTYWDYWMQNSTFGGSIFVLGFRALAWPFQAGLKALLPTVSPTQETALFKNNPYLKLYEEKAAKLKAEEERLVQEEQELESFIKEESKINSAAKNAAASNAPSTEDDYAGDEYGVNEDYY